MKKNIIDNPRYPHHIKIVRRVEKDWLDDDTVLAETVPNGTGTAAEETETGEEDNDNFIIIYEGEGRSYTDTTTTGDARVDSNKRKASIPVRFDEWPKAETDADATGKAASILVPMSGDLLYVTKGNICEEWEVKDFEPDNNRSVVYGEMNRNFNI